MTTISNPTNAAKTATANAATAIAEQAHAVQAGVEEMIAQAPGVLNGALKDAQDIARNGIERARQASAKVRDQVGAAGEKTVHYIQDEPVKSVLIAAGVGAITALLINWLAKRDS